MFKDLKSDLITFAILALGIFLMVWIPTRPWVLRYLERQ